MAKAITLYEIREYVGTNYSKPLGSKLRSKSRVTRLVKRLSKQGRELVIASHKVTKPKTKTTKSSLYQFEVKPWIDWYTFK